jgi:prepilin-type N-terminal cleavage/methylation domain-containing protein
MKRLQGFTLIELMITVAIIGVLAAVAIPVFSAYLHESKTSEVPTVLLAIKEKQETYFATFKCYTDSTGYHPYSVALPLANGICGNSHLWGTLNSAWMALGFHPGGPTYYSYAVQSSDSACSFSGAARPKLPGVTWTGGQRSWFVARAKGDVDCDGTLAEFYTTSATRTVYHVNEDVY